MITDTPECERSPRDQGAPIEGAPFIDLLPQNVFFAYCSDGSWVLFSVDAP